MVDYLAAQLGVADPSVVKRYVERQKTPYEHAWEIREVFGYRDFDDQDAADGLREFLDGRAWVHAEGPHALFEQAVAWLRRHRVLLPGVTTAARLVAVVRAAAAERMYQTLTEAAVGADARRCGPGAAAGARRRRRRHGGRHRGVGRR